MKKTVLITFGRSFLTLTCARMFAAAGYRVVVVDSVGFAISRYSNSIHKFYRVTSPAKDPKAYADDLVSIAKKEHVDLLIPMWEDICHVTLAKDRFPANCSVFAPPFDIYNELLNKWSFQKLLDRLGIKHPRTELVKDSSDLHQLSFDVPYALKPVYSRASQHVHRVIPGGELPHIHINDRNPWVAQEWIAGKSFCTYSVCRDGKVLAHSTYPVRYTVDGHNCLSFQYIDHQNILKWIQNLVKKINYTGQIAFDFIEDSEGELFAIECNPRATNGILLFERNQGFDKAFTETFNEVLTPREKSSRQVATGMLMFGWKKKSNYSGSIRGYLKDLLTTRDVIMSRRDPVPFMTQPYVFAQILWRSRKAGQTIPNYFIDDHIWDG